MRRSRSDVVDLSSVDAGIHGKTMSEKNPIRTPATKFAVITATPKGTHLNPTACAPQAERVPKNAPNAKVRLHRRVNLAVTPMPKPNITWLVNIHTAPYQGTETANPHSAERQHWKPKTAPKPVASKVLWRADCSVFDFRIGMA